jgi:streptogramin lyase
MQERRFSRRLVRLATVLIMTVALSMLGCDSSDEEEGTIGSGSPFGAPNGIAVEAAGTLAVVDEAPRAVLRVDPTTGDRTTVSDAATGSGPDFQGPVGIAVEATGTLVVVDAVLKAVVRVDSITGDRTIISQ